MRRIMSAVAVTVVVAGLAVETTGKTPEPVTRVAGRTLAQWRSELGSKKRTRRLRAVLTLPSFQAASVPGLVEALEHSDAAVRYWAASGLGDLGHRDARTPQVFKRLQAQLKHKSVGLRISAGYALCRLGQTKTGLPVLTGALEHPHRGVACSAADFLARIGPPAAAAVPALEAATRHKDNHVKNASNEALKRIRAGRKGAGK